MKSCCFKRSLRKYPFLLALRLWGRFAPNVPSGEERGETDVFAGYFKRFRAYSISLNSSNVGTFFLELNSKRLCLSSGKDKESRCLQFTSSSKRIIMHFLVVVVPWRQRTVQKSAMHVQICCFANLNQFLFLPFSFFVVAHTRNWRFDNLCRGHHRYRLNTTQHHSFASRVFTAEITAWLTDDLEAVNMEERS